MKFAFIIMGEDFHPENDRAAIHGGTAQIIGVSSLDEACKEAIKLKGEGINCIELCGAFGPESAMRVIDAVQNSLPVGYVKHFPIQDDIYRKVFGE